MYIHYMMAMALSSRDASGHVTHQSGALPRTNNPALQHFQLIE